MCYVEIDNQYCSYFIKVEELNQDVPLKGWMPHLLAVRKSTIRPQKSMIKTLIYLFSLLSFANIHLLFSLYQAFSATCWKIYDFIAILHLQKLN